MKYDQYLFYLGLFYFVILKKKNKNYVILYAVEKIEAILTVFLNFFILSLVPNFDLRIETMLLIHLKKLHSFEFLCYIKSISSVC